MRDKRRIQKKTAEPAGPRNGGNLVKKLGRTSVNDSRTSPLSLTRVHMVACFSDVAYLYCWEAVR